MHRPRLVIGDGALEIWAALGEVGTETRRQRCWNHRLLNVLDRLPKRPWSQLRQDPRHAIAAPTRGSTDVYQRALELLAVELYRSGTVTMGQAAKLAGMPLGDFIDLCGKLPVPVLWEPAEGVGPEVDRLEGLLHETGPRD